MAAHLASRKWMFQQLDGIAQQIRPFRTGEPPRIEASSFAAAGAAEAFLAMRTRASVTSKPEPCSGASGGSQGMNGGRGQTNEGFQRNFAVFVYHQQQQQRGQQGRCFLSVVLRMMNAGEMHCTHVYYTTEVRMRLGREHCQRQQLDVLPHTIAWSPGRIHKTVAAATAAAAFSSVIST